MQGLHKSLSCTAFSFCCVVSMQFMSGKGYTVIVCSIAAGAVVDFSKKLWYTK